MAFSLFDLGQALNAGAGAVNNYRQQSALGDLGTKLRSGDFTGAAQTALAAGDVGTGLELLKLGETRKQKDEQRQSDAAASALIGGSVPLSGAVQTAPGGQGASSSNLLPAFAQAGTRYGISPDYLSRTAQIESGMNPNAHNASGADGLMQFVPSTAKQYGLTNPLDPNASIDAAARLASDNKRVLVASLGRAPSDAELYLAHQQGAEGASKLLANPNAPAASIVGRQAIIQNGGRENMTAGEFAGMWLNKFGGSPQQFGQQVASNDTPQAVAPASDERAKLEQRRSQIESALSLPNISTAKERALKIGLDSVNRQLTEMAPTSGVKEYNLAKQQGFAGSFMDFKKASAPQTTINTGGGPSKNVYDTVEKRTEDARAAAQSLPAFQEAKRLLDSGNITLGAGADLRVGMQKIGALFGLDPTAASNAETFRATVAPTVLALVKGLGAGAGISNADRDFAEKAAGGNINLEPGTIRRILQIGQRAAQAKIAAHNKMVDSVYPESGDTAGVRSLFKVDVPAYEPPQAAPQAAPQAQQGQLKPAPTDLISEAQSALKAGRDRGAIIEKMRSLGYDPSGL